MTPLKTALIVAGSVLILFLAFAAFMIVRDHQRAEYIVELQNQIASRDKTIEIKEGLYQKLTLQSKDLSKLLDNKDLELTNLRDHLKKQKAELLTVNTLVVKLRQELKDARDVVVTIPDPLKPGVKNFDIDTDGALDPFQVKGKAEVDCDANKAHYDLRLSQRSPIRFSVIVSQDKDGTWRSSATSSTKVFAVDIALAGVNPYLLEERWYEKIGIGIDAAMGTVPGFLGGIGLFYEIGKIELGPKAWFTVTSQGVHPYFGAQLIWHPFKRTF